MIKVLLDKNLKQYRANLHCHSTISDGKKSVEELKEFYKKNGYSVLAYTDHDVFIPHNDLTDDEFVALNGYEMEIGSPTVKNKTCHMCLVALEPDNFTPVCFHRSRYFFGNAKEWIDKVRNDEAQPDYERAYNPERINDMFKKGREGGFFVTYNHPAWSIEDYPDYIGYEGMHAMEIVNYSCVRAGYDDDNGRVYNDLLRSGKRIYAVANDDNHNRNEDYSAMSDSFGGYNMILAEKLDYKSITDALMSGNFYASSGTSTHKGPELYSLTWDTETKTLALECSGVRAVNVITNTRPNFTKRAEDGEVVESASFVIDKPEHTYFRLELIDREGYKAYTCAYFIDELN